MSSIDGRRALGRKSQSPSHPDAVGETPANVRRSEVGGNTIRNAVHFDRAAFSSMGLDRHDRSSRDMVQALMNDQSWSKMQLRHYRLP